MKFVQIFSQVMILVGTFLLAPQLLSKKHFNHVKQYLNARAARIKEVSSKLISKKTFKIMIYISLIIGYLFLIILIGTVLKLNAETLLKFYMSSLNKIAEHFQKGEYLQIIPDLTLLLIFSDNGYLVFLLIICIVLITFWALAESPRFILKSLIKRSKIFKRFYEGLLLMFGLVLAIPILYSTIGLILVIILAFLSLLISLFAVTVLGFPSFLGIIFAIVLIVFTLKVLEKFVRWTTSQNLEKGLGKIGFILIVLGTLINIYINIIQ